MSEQIASAEDYRQRNTAIFSVPSGVTFRLRRPGPEVWLKHARLPANLRASFERAKASGEEEEDGEKKAGLCWLRDVADEDLAAWVEFCAAMVKAICVQPKIVVLDDGQEPRAGELSSDELESADFWALFAWGFKGGETLPVAVEGGAVSVNDLRKFRHQPGLSPTVPSGGQAECPAVANVGAA